MTDLADAPSKVRLPLGFLGMIALLIATETWIERSERASFLSEIAESWKHSGRAATHEARSAEFLFFGDSMVKFGVAPRVFEARTGRRSYNLASYAGSPAESYFLLRRALDSGAKPRAVVVNFSPHLLALQDSFHIRQWQASAGMGEAFDLASQNRDASLFATIFLGRSVPSIRARLEIRKSLTMALEGKSYSWVIAQFFHPWMRNWHVNGGGETRVRVPSFHDEANPADGALFPKVWTRNPVAVGYMERFLSLAESRKIPVYWLITPIHPASQSLRAQLGLDNQFTSFIRGVQDRHPGVVVVDGRGSEYATSAFYDPVHLIAPGSSALTIDLAEIVVHPDVRTSRWIALPHYRERPAIVALENEDESRQALAARRR